MAEIDKIALRDGILVLVEELKAQTSDPVAAGQKFANDLAELIDTYHNNSSGGITEEDIHDYDLIRGEGGSITLTKDTLPLTTLNLAYIHDQGLPSNIWNITHGLNKKPGVTVIDTANSVVRGHVQYLDNNSVILTFNYSFSGSAIFN